MDDFKSGRVCVAAMTFLRNNDKYKVKPSKPVPQGKFSLHIEEQKLPPMEDDLVFRSASIVPMLSSEWQDRQDPEDRERSASAVKYRWDGRFVNNPKISGAWKVIAQVADVADFDPAARLGKIRKVPFTEISFEGRGKTADPLWVWSGDTLMDLGRYEALKIVPRTLRGTEYLFIEEGGFSSQKKPGWKSSWLVLIRRQGDR